MRLRQLFEAEIKTAVASFGRLNPPTTGHNAMVSEIKKVPGDHFLFLSHSQGAKNADAKPGTKAGENKDPLSFSEKLPLAKQAFPDVNVGYADVTTIFDMPVKLYKLGYKKLVIVAGNDRMPSYKSIFPKYNGVEGDHGYYKFDNIEFVELTRDEEAEGVEGMSASKLRQAVRNNDFESFKTGLIAGNPQQLFDTIKERLAVDSLGVKQEEPKQDSVEEDTELSELTVRQQLPKIEVLNNIASRKDNTPFPLSYKNTGGASSGGQVYVSPETARKFIGFYEKRSPDEQELMQKALKSVNGVKNLFNNIGLTIDVKMDPKSENIPAKNPLDDLLGD